VPSFLGASHVQCVEMSSLIKKFESELEAAGRELQQVRQEKEISEQKFDRLKSVLDKERQALFEVTAAARKTMEEQHRKKVELEDRLKFERDQRASAEEGRERNQQTLDTAVTRAVVAEGRWQRAFHELLCVKLETSTAAADGAVVKASTMDNGRLLERANERELIIAQSLTALEALCGLELDIPHPDLTEWTEAIETQEIPQTEISATTMRVTLERCLAAVMMKSKNAKDMLDAKNGEAKTLADQVDVLQQALGESNKRIASQSTGGASSFAEMSLQFQAQINEVQKQADQKVSEVQAAAQMLIDEAKQTAAAAAEAVKRRVQAEIEATQKNAQDAVESEKQRAQAEIAAAEKKAADDAESEKQRAQAEIAAVQKKAADDAASEKQRAQAEIDAVQKKAADDAESEKQRAQVEIDAVQKKAADDAEVEKQRAQAEVDAVQKQAADDAESEKQRAQAEIDAVQKLADDKAEVEKQRAQAEVDAVQKLADDKAEAQRQKQQKLLDKETARREKIEEAARQSEQAAQKKKNAKALKLKEMEDAKEARRRQAEESLRKRQAEEAKRRDQDRIVLNHSDWSSCACPEDLQIGSGNDVVKLPSRKKSEGGPSPSMSPEANGPPKSPWD